VGYQRVTDCDGRMMARLSTLVFDVETTGIPHCFDIRSRREHEILQLALVNGLEQTLFNRMFAPIYVDAWGEAEKIHGIGSEAVKHLSPITAFKSDIQCIIDAAELLVAYNFRFDYYFLRNAGFSFSGKRYYDVMQEFARRHGKRRSDGSKAYVSLKTCADFYGYPSFREHDAEGDACATLHCYLKMQEELYE